MKTRLFILTFTIISYTVIFPAIGAAVLFALDTSAFANTTVTLINILRGFCVFCTIAGLASSKFIYSALKKKLLK